MTRVLAFTPYTLWDFHTNYETTITRACQVRGAEVKHIRCDSLFGECDMSNAEMSPTGRPPGLCALCRSRGDVSFEGTGLATEWLSRYLEPGEREEASAWAQGLAPEHLETAQFHGFPLGEWVLSSVVSYFRTYPVRVDDGRVAGVFRGFLHAGALTSLGLTRALDDWKPDALVVFNGRRSVTYIAFVLARRRGIRVLVHERPQRPGTVMVAQNEHCLSLEPFKRLWADWGDVPLARGQLQQVADWLRDRRFGHNQKGIHRFTNAPGQRDAVRQALGLVPGRKIAALYTSSTDEYAGTPGFVGPFASQEEWIERVAAWAGRRSDCDLVIRAHPNLAGAAGAGGSADAEIRWLQGLGTRLPGNARLVMPQDPLSTYDLMDVADLGITYGSTAGVEVFALGKPVVTTPPIAFYDGVPSVFTVLEPGALEATLDAALAQGPSRELRRMAFRCLSLFYFHLPLPFPLVSVTRLTDTRVSYDSAEALAPGRDPSLDRICGFLLEDKPIFPAPDAQQRRRTADEEDAFFTRLEADPHWLEVGWRERGRAKMEQARDALVSLPITLATRTSGPLRPVLRRLWRALPGGWRRKARG